MVGNHDGNPVEVVEPTAHSADGVLEPEESLSSGAPESDDGPGANNIDLGEDEGEAGLHFFGCRFSVSRALVRHGWSEFADV